VDRNRGRPRARSYLTASAVAVLAIGLGGVAGVGAVRAEPSPAYVDAGSGPVQSLPALGPFGVNNANGPSPSGRIQDIAADPFVAHRYLALSDAALWQSTNDGHDWTRLVGLGRFAQWNFEHGTIAFDRLVRGVVLIASPADRRMPSGVGIYRSTDGGQLWQPAINSRPICADSSTGSPSVVVFRGHEALAAAGCVVGRSTDDGAHWTWSAPDSVGGFGGVALDLSGNRFACGTGGIFKQIAIGWTRVVDFTGGPWPLGTPIAYGSFGTCRITASPVEANHVFFAARWTGLAGNLSGVAEARLSNGSWPAVDLFGGGHPNGRDVLVQTRPSADTGFYLYWGTDDAVQFQKCSSATSVQECTAGTTHDESQPDPPWVYLGQGDDPNGLHADQTRIIFSQNSPYCILFVANDGGIQKPRPGNCTGVAQLWDYTDRGISAAEFYEISGTAITGYGRAATDLYGASQDNDMFVQLDGDAAWRHISLNGDSFLVDATAEVRSTDLTGVTTFVQSNGVQWIGLRGLASRANPAPGNTLYTAPCTGLGSRHQVDETLSGRMAMLCVTSSLTPPTASIYTSGDHGQTWTAVANSTVTGRNNDQSGASLYVTRTASGANSYLVRIAGALWSVVPGSAPVRLMGSGWDVGRIASASDGSRILTFACPPAPQNCTDGRIRIWYRSTNQWHDVPIVTSLLTQDWYNHQFALDTGQSTDGQASSVAIAPHDPQLMAIASLDSGVLLSGDSGISWQRVPISVGNLSQAWFDNFDRLYIAAYGRGVLGGVVPRPHTLRLTRNFVSMSADHQLWTWSARLRDASSAPVSGASIRFTLKNDSTGEETEVGYGTTNHEGLAIGSRNVPAGSYRLIARWQPQNNADVVTQQPLLAEPTVTISSPARSYQVDPFFVLRFVGVNPDDPKSLLYDVRYRISTPRTGFGSYVRPKALQGITADPLTIKAAPGEQWCIGVRAYDAEGRTSPWTADRCTTIPVDDGGLKQVTDGWSDVSSTSAFLSTVTRTSLSGQTLRLYNVTAHRVVLLVTMCPRCGPVAIYIDNQLYAVQSTYASKITYKALLKPIVFPQREVTISIRSVKDKPVLIDGIAVARAAP
jgi:hypothetical protein